jgi:membrane protein involved in colicin uptake
LARVIQQQEKLRDERILRHGQQGISQNRKAHCKKGSADAVSADAASADAASADAGSADAASADAASADAVSAEQWKSTKLPDLLQKCSAGDIYNADETGLFYRAKPDGSLS